MGVGFDAPKIAGVRGQGAGLEEAGGPQPLIHSYGFHALFSYIRALTFWARGSGLGVPGRRPVVVECRDQVRVVCEQENARKKQGRACSPPLRVIQATKNLVAVRVVIRVVVVVIAGRE